MLRSVCQHYRVKGMFSSKCKRCGDPKEGHAVLSYTGKPDALYDLCDLSFTFVPVVHHIEYP